MNGNVASAIRADEFAKESARDLIKHAGWEDYLARVDARMKAERHRLLYPKGDDESAKIAAAAAAARGAIVATKNLIFGVYSSADVPVPPKVRAMFE